MRGHNDIESRTVGYEYDDRGLRTKLTYLDDSNVTYEYDSMSRLTEVKYEGSITREYTRARDLIRKGGKQIPGWLDYASVPGLSLEATEKLSLVRPRSIGQAARVPGITPADVSSVLIHIERQGRMLDHG